ncbi:GntR family transcriptional regulator [Alteribacillus sp. YIM 98480]|uniref:GntR family transcriptional regulator n=1 Tax=Alteribacillus sp. YIM 98480 TaxID=2606599 RepID=UPI00131A985A|nr:GntR family transcriptional regulator [Alteribacillus sp. YIM 98480]
MTQRGGVFIRGQLVDRQNAVPLYAQLKEIIKTKIDKNIWAAGDLIPTEMSLIQTYEVSRTTVRQALSELVSEGILYKIQGRGTFVAEPKLEPIRPKLTGFKEDMEDEGHVVDSLILNEGWETVKGKEWNPFSLNEGNKVYRLNRLRRVNGVVIGIHRTILNMNLYPEVNLEKHNFESESLYETLRKYNIPLGEAHESVEASTASFEHANHLNVEPDTLVLKLQRFTKLQDGRLFEAADMIYRADKYKYKTILY